MNVFGQNVSANWTKINLMNFIWTLIILLDDYTHYSRNEYPSLSS